MVLSAKEEAQIIDEEIEAMFAEEEELADQILEDGGMPGDIALPGPQRLDRYWAVTPDLSDVLLLVDPDWESRIRAGLDKGPVNPYWINLLREPGLLKKTSQDFVRLNKQHEDRYEGGADEAIPPAVGQPAPVAPSGGPPGYG